MAITGFCARVVPELNAINVIMAQAAAGARQPQNHRADGRAASVVASKMRCLSPVEGRRGRQERNCVSGKLILFMLYSFQLGF